MTQVDVNISANYDGLQNVQNHSPADSAVFWLYNRQCRLTGFFYVIFTEICCLRPLLLRFYRRRWPHI